MRKTILTFAAAMLAIPAAPALAGPPSWAPAHGYRDNHPHAQYYHVADRRDYRRDSRRVYDDRGRYYCRRDNGTTGLIVGAAGGALVGRAIDTRGERVTGTILGAAIGGLLGREIDRGEARCR